MKYAATLCISPHRLARLTAWAGLWLQAFAALLLTLTAADAPAAQRALARMAQFVTHIVTLRAAMNFRPRSHRPRWRTPVARSGMRRSLIGAALRRRLSGRDLVTRFFAVLCVMRDLDSIVARQAKRLMRGLTRLRPILAAPECACGNAPAAIPPYSGRADSS